MFRIALIVSVLVAAGCTNDNLRQVGSNGLGPDEFLVLPVAPLESPASFTQLPPPTPGGTNRTDPTPKVDAVVALGGSAQAATSQSIPGSDATLVAHASRNGVPQNIRQTLAEEDEVFRRNRGRFTQFRLFRTDRYNQVYRRQALDPFEVERQARGRGIPTPSAPPGFE